MQPCADPFCVPVSIRQSIASTLGRHCGHYGIRTHVILLDRQAPHHSAPSARVLPGVSLPTDLHPSTILKERFLIFLCQKTISSPSGLSSFLFKPCLTGIAISFCPFHDPVLKQAFRQRDPVPPLPARRLTIASCWPWGNFCDKKTRTSQFGRVHIFM